MGTGIRIQGLVTSFVLSISPEGGVSPLFPSEGKEPSAQPVRVGIEPSPQTSPGNPTGGVSPGGVSPGGVSPLFPSEGKEPSAHPVRVGIEPSPQTSPGNPTGGVSPGGASSVSVSLAAFHLVVFHLVVFRHSSQVKAKSRQHSQ